MMKKILLTAAAVLLATQMWAYDFSAVCSSGQTLYYNISGSNVTVTYPGTSSSSPYSGYTGPTGDLIIPSSVTHGGTTYSVTSIGNDAFYYCTSLTSVTIGNSVASIGNYAFYKCTGLTSVTIPNSVTSIGNYAFYNCTGLTSVTIPNSVTSIGNFAFYGCTGLTSVTIGNSVTSIGGSAFENCTGLTSVTIPNSVTSIEDWAFSNCTGLTSVTIPNSVTSIEYWAFRNCTGLTQVNWNAVNVTSYPTNTYYHPFNGCTNLATVVFGESVQRIPNYAFNGCTGLTSVTIPNSVTSIGEGAFWNCTGLTSVTIPNSVTSIGDYAFSDCTGLTSVTIGNSVTSIGGSAFENCTGLTLVNYTGTTSQWCGISFSNGYANPCLYAHNLNVNGTPLTDLVIPSDVTVIKNYAFDGCTSLTSVTIPNSVTSIGGSAFQNCTGLTSFTIPNSVTSIGSKAFYECSGLTSVIIPNSVTSIGEGAFWNCTGLTSVTIGNSVTSIEDYAFLNCIGLTSVTIGNSVTSIGIYAFLNCTGLTNVDVMAVVPPTLGSGVFYNTPDNMLINIPLCTYEDYSNSWGSMNFHEPEIDIDITITSSQPEWGNVSYILDDLNRIIRCDSTAVISATANYGYHFTQWSDGNTDNPRTVTLTQDTAFTASFAKNQYTINLSSNDTTLGTVSGSGTYEYLDTVSISATAIEHHHFVNWSDGNTDNPRYLVVTQDTILTAIFEVINGIDEYELPESISVYDNGMSVIISGAEGLKVQLFDTLGRIVFSTDKAVRTITANIPARGVYIVKVGEYKAKKVAVL